MTRSNFIQAGQSPRSNNQMNPQRILAKRQVEKLTRNYILYLHGLLVVGVLALFSLSSEAATNESSTTVSVESEKVKPEAKRLSMSATLETRSNLYEEGTAESSREASLDLLLSYKISKKYNMGINGVISKPFTDEETESALSNIMIYGSRAAIPLKGSLSLTPSIGAFLPTNKTATEDQKFRGGFDIKGKFSWKIQSLGINALYSLGARKDVYEFTTDANDNPLISYKITHGVGLSKPFLKKWSIALSGAYQTARDFDNRFYSKFVLGQSLSYEASSGISLAIGHTNAGNALRYDGRTSNIEAYDEDTSTIFGAISISN